MLPPRKKGRLRSSSSKTRSSLAKSSTTTTTTGQSQENQSEENTASRSLLKKIDEYVNIPKQTTSDGAIHRRTRISSDQVTFRAYDQCSHIRQIIQHIQRILLNN